MSNERTGISRLGATCAILIAVATAGCATAANGASGPTAPNARPAAVVAVAKATTGAISQVISYTGTAQAGDSVNVAPTISGRVTKLNVDVGSVVKAGDLIAELDQSTLNAQVEQAQAGLNAARAKLAQVQAGARPEAVAAANANTAAAQAKLDALKAGARAETIAQAKANLDAAKAKLAAVAQGPRPENVAAAKANLDAAKAKLAQLKAGPTQEQIGAAQITVEQAKDALWTQQSNRDGVCGNPRNPKYMCDAANAQVSVSQTALDQAQQQLKILTSPPTKEALDQAQAAVDAAQQAYLLAQQPYTAQDLAQAQAAVDVAQQAYQLAQNAYTAQDLAQAQAAVDAATNQAKLVAQPYTDADLKSAQAAVDQAQAALDLARAQLAQAQITAPFDGVVSARLLSVGALASPSTPIVTIMSRDLQVQFAVDESRVGNIKAGQAVTLTSSAFPGKEFPASITSVYPSADPKTHTFVVVAKPNDTSGDLRAGMFLTLGVTVASFPDATLVPNAAVVQQGSQSVVFSVANGQAHLVPVTTGISDDNFTQILSGINPGDQVAISNQASLTDGAAVRVAAQPGGGNGGQGAGGSAAPSRPPGAAVPPGQRPSVAPVPAPAP